MSFKLLAVSNDAKTVKGETYGYLTGVLYLAPAELASVGKNLCPWSSPGCRETCLNTAGRGIYTKTQAGRIRKTRLLFEQKEIFHEQLLSDIRALVRKANRLGLTPCVRLDGTSDLGLALHYAKEFPNIQFYDYTKSYARMQTWLRARQNRKIALASNYPLNYHLTFSMHEDNQGEAVRISQMGGNVAVVFNTKRKALLPATFMGVEVIDGDRTDLRFLDPNKTLKGDGYIIGLRAKGKARKDTSGFVIRVAK